MIKNMSIIALALTVSFFSFGIQSSFASSINIPGLSKTCLPVSGRMLTDRSASCHCPPESLCPQNITEWNEAQILPPYIANVCCTRPRRCSAHTGQESFTTKCPGRVEYPRSVGFCAQMQPREVVGAQELDDPDYDESLTENVEQARRVQASEQFNSCYQNSCRPILDTLNASSVHTNWRVTAGRQYYDRGSSFFQYYHDRREINGDLFGQYTSCEFQCRQQAASVLGVSLNGDLQRIINDILYNRDSRGAMFRAHGANRIHFNDSFHRLISLSRHADLESPVLLSSSLDAQLTCVIPTSANICLYKVDNNGTCGSCLSPETLVTLANGEQKKISEIAKGDEVKTSGGLTAKVAEVVERDWPSLTLYSINDGALELTADHPIMTKNGWRAVDYNGDMASSMKKYGLQNVPELQVGDVVVLEEGHVEVQSIAPLPTVENGKTFNLKLESGSGFYANGIFVKSN